jgi:hypothetical protein
MQKRRQINAEPGAERLRSSVAAATEPVRAAAWTVEERMVSGADWARDQAERGADWARDQADRARPHAEVLRWPFERVAWLAERWVVWPIQERVSISNQMVGAAGLAVLAIALVAFSVVTLSAGDSAPERVVATVPVAAPTPAPTTESEAPAEPLLKGAPPSFGLGDGVGVAAATNGDAGAITAGTSTTATISEGESGAATSSEDPVPAGPAAMRVARHFAEAFVLYEIGQRPERTQAIFEETTSPRLATALEERPPRQPAGVEVPQARVLNLVPGPRSGSAYTVSASLLRLGTTSELRLVIRRKNGTWVVTDVRG